MAYPVSANFRNYIAGSHKVVVQADVCDSAGNVLVTFNPVNGSVNIDIDRDVRRDAGTIELVDPTGVLVPLNVTDVLSPLLGNELRLYRGVEYSDGTTELMPLGVFIWQSVSILDDGSGLKIVLSGLQDRSVKVAQARYSRPVSVTSATAVETVIANIVSAAYPTVVYSGGQLPATSQTINAVAYGVEGDASPWQDARDLADQFGFRLFFDAIGELNMTPIQKSEAVTSVVSYGDSGELMIVSMSKDWDITDTFNGVIATGQGSGLLIPARAVAWDDDPSSPTYYLGTFGQRPRYYSSPFLLTDAQARAAAESQLEKTLGVSEKLTWSQIVDPSLDVGDTIQVVRSSMTIAAQYVLDRLTIPLSPAEMMSADVRARRVI